jgi:hypothetical protein
MAGDRMTAPEKSGGAIWNTWTMLSNRVNRTQFFGRIEPVINVAIVETNKAERLMKALCNHFSRKTKASYEGSRGYIQFQYGVCRLEVVPSALKIWVEADHEENLTRTKKVVTDHLLRFAPDEALQVDWGNEHQ